ncbi:hypothetical protein D0U04_20855 [Bacillus clarus]|uniref:Uncharacterized protein n=1 Tax=Bacillus clarus TaxID=2338372 RepID=A0ABX9KRF1_9BACI|nr:hypothetical protein [Bacillus clarus]RFT64919.1 hypothetical protein D0U04_20855 [Bacillus clarus]
MLFFFFHFNKKNKIGSHSPVIVKEVTLADNKAPRKAKFGAAVISEHVEFKTADGLNANEVFNAKKVKEHF